MVLSCRSKAYINRSRYYSPHFTLGILLHATLPEAIKRSRKSRWQQLIAEDYLAVNYLTDFAYVSLIRGELEMWDLYAETDGYSVHMEINFWRKNKKILTSDVYTKNVKVCSKFQRVVTAVFEVSANIYLFLIGIENVWKSWN